MPAYFIGTVAVHDPDEYQKYLASVGDTFAPFGGRVLVATAEAELVEGEWPEARTVVVEFPSKDRARQWHESSAYRAVVGHRHRAATSHFVIANGIDQT